MEGEAVQNEPLRHGPNIQTHNPLHNQTYNKTYSSQDYFNFYDNPVVSYSTAEFTTYFAGIYEENMTVYPVLVSNTFTKDTIQDINMLSCLPIVWYKPSTPLTNIQQLEGAHARCRILYNFNNFDQYINSIIGPYWDFSIQFILGVRMKNDAPLSQEKPWSMFLLVKQKSLNFRTNESALYQSIFFCSNLANFDDVHFNATLFGTSTLVNKGTKQYSLDFGQVCILSDISLFISSLIRQITKSFFVGDQTLTLTYREGDISPELLYVLSMCRLAYETCVKTLNWKVSILNNYTEPIPEIQATWSVKHVLIGLGQTQISEIFFKALSDEMAFTLKSLFYKRKKPGFDFLPSAFQDVAFNAACEMVDMSLAYVYTTMRDIRDFANAQQHSGTFYTFLHAPVMGLTDFIYTGGLLSRATTKDEAELSTVLNFLCPFKDDLYSKLDRIENHTSILYYIRTTSEGAEGQPAGLLLNRNIYLQRMNDRINFFLQSVQSFELSNGKRYSFRIDKKQNEWCVSVIMFRLFHREYTFFQSKLKIKEAISRDKLPNEKTQEYFNAGKLYCRSVLLYIAQNMIVSNFTQRKSINDLYNYLLHEIKTVYVELPFNIYLKRLLPEHMVGPLRKTVDDFSKTRNLVTDSSILPLTSYDFPIQTKTFLYPFIVCGSEIPEINSFTTQSQYDIRVENNEWFSTAANTYKFMTPFWKRRLSGQDCSSYVSKSIMGFVPQLKIIPKDYTITYSIKPTALSKTVLPFEQLKFLPGIQTYFNVPFFKTNFYNIQDYTIETLIRPLQRLYKNVEIFSTQEKKAIFGVKDTDVYLYKILENFEAIVDPDTISDSFVDIVNKLSEKNYTYYPYLSPELNFCIMRRKKKKVTEIWFADIETRTIIEQLTKLYNDKNILFGNYINNNLIDEYIGQQEQEGDFILKQNSWWAAFVIVRILQYVVDGDLSNNFCLGKCREMINWMKKNVLRVMERERNVGTEQMSNAGQASSSQGTSSVPTNTTLIDVISTSSMTEPKMKTSGHQNIRKFLGKQRPLESTKSKHEPTKSKHESTRSKPTRSGLSQQTRASGNAVRQMSEVNPFEGGKAQFQSGAPSEHSAQFSRNASEFSFGL